jgi:AraC-like DNA-binding protein
MGEHYGPRAESFRFTDIWQLHLYFWRGVFRVGSECFEVGPEMVSLLPPGAEVTWQFPQGKCDHHFIHFRLPGKRRLKAIPTVIPVRSHYDLINRLVSFIVSDHGADPFAAEIALWSLLFQLAELQTDHGLKILPGPVETARTLMDSELSTGIDAMEVAKRIGYSRSQINRLYREHTGQTLAEYLAAQRLGLAKELLAHSNLTIGQVARRIGIPDPNVFNKFIRRHLGVAPRELRCQQTPHPAP